MSVYNNVGKPLFPAFFDLSDREVLVVGRGAEADRKAEKMAPFCRRVIRCDYPPVFEEKPALAILVEPGHPDNAHWAARFREMGIPVNVCDRPEFCDFRFPALVTRGAVSVGIATAGAAPVLAGLLRQKIDAVLPDDLEGMQTAAAALTTELRQSVPDPRERTRLLREELAKILGCP
jgi:siroheme synthase (precorrin-2 oxidase/ferrochelatase)